MSGWLLHILLTYLHTPIAFIQLRFCGRFQNGSSTDSLGCAVVYNLKLFSINFSLLDLKEKEELKFALQKQ